MIANTAHPTENDPAPDEGARVDSEQESTEPPSSPSEPSPPRLGLAEKWRAYGPREFVRRGVRKAVRSVLPGWILDDVFLVGAGSHAPCLADDRTVAQLRAVTQLLGNLDGATAQRHRVQSRRKRSDREIFERFPLHVIPTYPGDDRLFSSEAFKAWLGEDLPLVHAAFDDIMKA